MKNYIKLFSFAVFFFCYQPFADAQNVPENDAETTARDTAEAILQAKAAEFNFTASMGSQDREVVFHLNRTATLQYENNSDITWNFGDGTISKDAKPVHRYETPGTYTVTLRIADSATIVKEGVFTVTQTGLRVKHVEDSDITWPNGNPTTMLSPFTYRLKNFYAFDYHRGLDIVGNIGDEIVSVADGYVYQVTRKGGSPTGGTKILYIKHVMDTPIYIFGQVISYYYSSHRHLEYIDVDRFQQVRRGQRVASLGRSGLSGSVSLKPHNHFEIRLGTIKQTLTLSARGESQGSNNSGRYHDVSPAGNIHNEFNTPAAGDIVPDSRVHPNLFLNKDANQNTSLRYTVEEIGDNLVVTVRSDFGEDMFNEIEVQYNSANGNTGNYPQVHNKINQNTREGLPSKQTYDATDTYYDVMDNDMVEIIPIRFHDRDLPGESFDFKMTFRFKNHQKSNHADDFIKVRDIYGNEGRRINYEPGLVINEVSFESDNDYNLDGFTNSNNDDFVEIVNNSNTVINLKDYKIYDKARFDGFDELGFIAARSPRLVGDVNPDDPRLTLGDIDLGPGEILLVFSNISAEAINTVKESNQKVKAVVSTDLHIGQSREEKIFLVDRYFSVLDIASNENFYAADEDNHYALVRSPELTGNFIKIDTATPGVVEVEDESCFVIRSKKSSVSVFCL